MRTLQWSVVCFLSLVMILGPSAQASDLLFVEYPDRVTITPDPNTTQQFTVRLQLDPSVASPETYEGWCIAMPDPQSAFETCDLRITFVPAAELVHEGNGVFRADFSSTGGIVAGDVPTWRFSANLDLIGSDPGPSEFLADTEFGSVSVASPDLNGDLRVDLVDVGIFSSLNDGSYSPFIDFVPDGLVNLADIGFLVANIGASCQ